MTNLSDDSQYPATESDLDPGVAVTTKSISDYWGVVLALGLISVVFGLVLAVWPDQTVKVISLLIAVNLVIWGCGQLLLAIVPSTLHRGSRLLMAGSAVLSVTIGVMFVFDPTRTVGAVATLAGIALIVAGVADIVQCWITGPLERIWGIVGGVLLIGAGIFLWVRPEASVKFLVLLSCIWMIGYGLITVFAALRLRKPAVVAG